MSQSTPRTQEHRTDAQLRRILDLFSQYQPFETLREWLTKGQVQHTAAAGLVGSAHALLINALSKSTHKPILVITVGPDESNDIYDDLAFLAGPTSVGHFPARQILPYDFRAPVGEIMGRRIATLSGILTGTTTVVVAPLRALLEPTISRPVLEQQHISLSIGNETDIDELVIRLLSLGFRRVPLVEEVGDFAKRGGLIDFFSPGGDAPVRVEFFGDVVETIRQFDVSTQRTINQSDTVNVLPKREVHIDHEALDAHLARLSPDDAEFIRTRYLNDPELPGLEWLSILFGVQQGRIFDFLPEETVVVYEQASRLQEEYESIMSEAETLRSRLNTKLTALPSPADYYLDFNSITQYLNRQYTVELLPFRTNKPSAVYFDCQPHPSLGSRLDLLADTIKQFDRTGVTYLITSDNISQAERLGQIITEKLHLENAPQVEAADLTGGFVCPTGKFAILTDHEIFHRYHRRVRKKKFREGVAISDYSVLNRGDFVVHDDYGVAKYLGLETLVIDNRKRDCLALLYAESDKLFVPIEEFNRVGKYSGSDTSPELTRLGGNSWEKIKQRTQKAITEMAEDLLRIYAQRAHKTGHAYPEDSLFMRQLETSFPYDETPDQEKAISDVKRDLQSTRAMDRLICGDVGFGKTEVAIRAAFKVIDGGKQVAVLVPTTILAQQHFATFSERLRDFPVSIALLSRFRTKKEQLATIEQLAAGGVDLVIGTHRLLSTDIVFRDLGLLVIDEEHRFGVKHKEALRNLKATVDTMAMTATPIPRTLQMSLMGARDMSLITTSPKDRLPVLTEIVEFDDATIATAISRELDRGGQVFFVHNRVQTIEYMYEYLKGLLPKAEIGIAHGQMHERSLEGIMLAFMSGRYDILLCTSIIESGLDIPQANTMIINRADKFGLAQLYQLRGRVGRSSRRAYAYLMTPPLKTIRMDALKRLRALEAHADLGSGFALAMRDLEIRGAGTILGPKQSGYIEEIGFDLYNRLLEETVARLKGEEIERAPSTTLEMDVEIYLPESYVPESQQKVDIYRRLADAKDIATVDKIADEVRDRFGKLPQEAIDLFNATAVKILASQMLVEKLRFHSGRLTLLFSDKKQLSRAEVESLRRNSDLPMEFSFLTRPTIVVDLSGLNANERTSHLRKTLDISL